MDRSTPNHPKIQHYVPKFILEQFTVEGTDQIYAFDKTTGRSFRTNIKNVAAERAYYDITFEDTILSLEPALCECEGRAASALKGVRERENLSALSHADRVAIAQFALVQLVRGPSMRSQIRQVIEGMRNAATHFSAEGQKPAPTEFHIPEEEVQAMALEQIRKSSELVPILLDKCWILYRVPSQNAFYTSDNPIVIGNSTKPINGLPNKGLLCEGVEIYLPVSRDLMLAFYCRSVEAGWRISEAKMNIIKDSGVPLPETDSPSKDAFEECIRALNTGRAARISHGVASHQNEMQVIGAERFLFSAVDDFELARGMIAKWPDLKSGRRMIFPTRATRTGTVHQPFSG